MHAHSWRTRVHVCAHARVSRWACGWVAGGRGRNRRCRVGYSVVCCRQGRTRFGERLFTKTDSLCESWKFISKWWCKGWRKFQVVGRTLWTSWLVQHAKCLLAHLLKWLYPISSPKGRLASLWRWLQPTTPFSRRTLWNESSLKERAGLLICDFWQHALGFVS